MHTSSRCRRAQAAYVETLETRTLLSAYVVTNLNDSGAGSLRSAIEQSNAAAGGQVEFVPGLSGSITLTSGVLDITQQLTIDGPGAGVITVSGNHTSKVFQIDGSIIFNLSGIAVSNGNAGATPGGAIASSGLLDISSCTFTNNTAMGQSGGAIYSSGDLQVTDCLFANNSTTGDGGAIDIQSGGARITNCTFNANTARGPGTEGRGGAISEYVNNMLTVDGCNFSSNSAYGGGALYNYAVPATGGGYDIGFIHVANSAFWGNSATYGGAIESNGSMGVVSSTFYNNLAAIAGGAIESRGNFRITTSTLESNHADTGGGINVDLYPSGNPSNGELHNSIVAGNTRGSSAAANDISIVGAGILLGTYDLIGTGGAGTIYNGDYGNQVGVADPKLGAFGNYGGPTPTIPLLARSPALDAGSNADANDTWYLPPVPVTSDQRGLPRIYNGAVDIGAYEAQPPALAGDVNHDGKVDFADLVVLARHYGSTTQPLWEGGDLTGDGKVDFSDLVILARNYGNTAPAAVNAAALTPGIDLQPGHEVLTLRRANKRRH